LEPVKYENARELFKQPKPESKKKCIMFAGTYEMDVDTVIKSKERIHMIASEIWKITGYRFT
jgi:hypothetical protein